MQREDRQNKGDTWDEQLTEQGAFVRAGSCREQGAPLLVLLLSVFVKVLLTLQPSSTARFLRS